MAQSSAHHIHKHMNNRYRSRKHVFLLYFLYFLFSHPSLVLFFLPFALFLPFRQATVFYIAHSMHLECRNVLKIS